MYAPTSPQGSGYQSFMDLHLLQTGKEAKNNLSTYFDGCVFYQAMENCRGTVKKWMYFYASEIWTDYFCKQNLKENPS